MIDNRFKTEYRKSMDSIKLPCDYKAEILSEIKSSSPKVTVFKIRRFWASLVAAVLVIAVSVGMLLIPSLNLFEKTISIRVRSATNLTNISGARVVFVSPSGNLLTDKNGNTITAITDETGVANATIPNSESYNAQIEADGFVTLEKSVHNGNYYLSPVADENTYRAVLTWNKECDLDAHLSITTEKGTEKLNYYKSDIKDEIQNITATLDVDNEKGDGPETITFNVNDDTLIRFSVGSYSSLKTQNNLRLSDTEAQVTLYKGSTLIDTYHIKENSEGNVWCVFEIKNQNLRLCDYTYSVNSIAEIE